jgi:DNA-damage-inducible protein J
MQEATINVRLAQSLKQSGDSVLRREGVTVTQVVRGVYEYLQQEQRLPGFLGEQGVSQENDRIQKRRRALEGLAGIIPADTDVDVIRHDRLARQLQSGERL